jgi:ribosomal protein L11
MKTTAADHAASGGMATRARASRMLTAIAASVALVLAPVIATPAAANEEPTEVVAPASAALVGDLVVGGSVSVETGAWTPADAELGYVWWQSTEAYQAPVDGVDQNEGAVVIDGASTAQLPLDGGLEGRYVWAVVTGSAPGLTAASVVAPASGPVVLPSIPSVPDVSISGTAVVGAPLSAVLSAALPEGVAVAYQWRRAGVPIADAVDASYTAVAADALLAVDVVATYTAEGYGTATRESATVVIAKATFTGAPTVSMSGAVRVDSSVRAITGTWPAGTTFTYSWRFVDSKGVETVSSKTGQDYTPTANVLGRKLSVVVTGTVPGHLPVSKRSASVTIGAGAFYPDPTPTIAGSVYVGSTIKAVPGTWEPTPTLRYQWKRNGVAIAGATATSYKLTTSDYGTKITVTVTATRAGFPSTARTSAATVTVTKPFTNVSTPKITGAAKVGQVLTASAGAWSPTPTVSYQWKRDGVAVTGATGKTFTLKTADLGKKITVTVTYKRSGYFTRAVTSAATATVTAVATTMTREGWFTVGIDIAPGTYYSTDIGEDGYDCYFERRSVKTLTSATGLLGYWQWWEYQFGGQKVVTIKATDKYFYTDGCASWKPVITDLRTSVGDGTWVVGKQMEAGVWKQTGTVDKANCYIEAVRSFTGNYDVDFIMYGTLDKLGEEFRISTDMKGFTTTGCGTFVRVGD